MKDIPAFPAPAGVAHITEQGMTLRDYFAAAALQGICASGPTHEWTNSRLAAEAYDLADAMLEARNAAQ
jgi:hypothetical protein